MAQANIEEEIRKLREKNRRIEQGDPPVAEAKQEPIQLAAKDITWSALRLKEQLTGAPANLIEFESEPHAAHEGDQVLGEIASARIQVRRLQELLKRTAVHIAARNALGEKSEIFCAACNNARHEACILPEIWKAVGE